MDAEVRRCHVMKKISTLCLNHACSLYSLHVPFATSQYIPQPSPMGHSYASPSIANTDYRKKWESQPMIKNTPAGNLLLSAAILFAGALPNKILRVLEFLHCASIAPCTFKF